MEATLVQCFRCANWDPQGTPDKALVRQGHAACLARGLSKYHTFSADCVQACGKFSEAPAPIVEARRKFLDKK